MAGQLPQGSEGAAALTLIYASVSLCCSSMVIWLTWYHNERISYIACIAYFTLLATLSSLVQQVHVVAFYRDVTIAQFEHKLANPDSPDHNISNGSVGIDLVLFYIQFASYNIQSMFIMFWASELAQSVFGLDKKIKVRKVLRQFNYAGRAIAVAFPLIIVMVLRTPPPQNSLDLFILLADVPLMVSLGCGSALMMAILGRYIYSRRKLLRFDVHPVSMTDSFIGGSTAGLRRSSTVRRRRRAIYDRWLMTRFTIAFVLLAIFQLTGTLFQQFAMRNTANDIVADRPDLSAGRARTTFYLFMPGNTPGIALFIVFGTTATFRNYMYKTFVPARFRQNKPKLPLFDDQTDGDDSFVVSSPLETSPLAKDSSTVTSSQSGDWSPSTSSQSGDWSPITPSRPTDWSPITPSQAIKFPPLIQAPSPVQSSHPSMAPSHKTTSSSVRFQTQLTSPYSNRGPGKRKLSSPPRVQPDLKNQYSGMVSSARKMSSPPRFQPDLMSPSFGRAPSTRKAASPTRVQPDLMKSLPTPPPVHPRWRRASMGPGDDSKMKEGNVVFVMKRIDTQVSSAPRPTHERTESAPAVVLMKPQPYPHWI